MWPRFYTSTKALRRGLVFTDYFPLVLQTDLFFCRSLSELRADAESTTSRDSYADFYNAIAPQIPGFVAPSNRSTFSLSISVPESAEDAVAVLSADGWEFQSSVLDQSAFQYWGEIDTSGHVKIPNVRAGTYRLTVYAKGGLVLTGLVVSVIS